MTGMIMLAVRENVHLEDLAQYMAKEATQDDLLEFLLAVDAAVADLSFTKELHKTLGEVIELEEE